MESIEERIKNFEEFHDDISDVRRNAIIKGSSSSKNWSPFKGGKSKFSKAAAAIGNSVANSAKHWLEDKYNGLVNGDTKNDITANQIFTDEFDVIQWKVTVCRNMKFWKVTGEVHTMIFRSSVWPMPK